MAKASDLNVRLGLIFDEKALGQAERSLRRAGDRLTKVGNEMMTGLTLPLGLFGASAIKAAGDLESLTLALQSQTGSAAKASEELQKLTEVSRNPGLGLEQSVRASIRLQSVGIAADEARGIITQLGNAIASTGGTAQEFDSVTRQFAQMISKGKLLQEDISIISENMPVVSQLMQKAFGTANVEAIREMGIGAKEFVTQITAAASELPRVGGGIKNNLANVIDELQISLGKVGLALEKSFNITGNLTNFAVWIGDVAAAFSSLNPTVQSAILYFGGLLVAIGPIAKLIGNIQLVSSLLVSGWASLVTGGKALIASVLSLRSAILALNVATQAFIGIGLAVAVYMLVDYFGAFNRELTTAEQRQQAITEVTSQAAKSIAKEKSEIERIIPILESETTSREEKEKALKRLQEISPQYFGGLKIEDGLVKNLEASYKNYVDALLSSARAQAAREMVIKLTEQQIELELQLGQRLKEKADADKLYGNAAKVVAENAIAANKEQRNAIQSQISALNNLIYQEEVRQGIIKTAPPRDFSDLTGLKMESDELRQNSLLYKLNSEAVNKATTAKSTFKQVTDGATEGTKKNTKAQKDLNDELEKTASIQSKPIPNFGQLPTLPTPTSVQSESPTLPNIAGATVQAGDIYQTFSERLGSINTQMKDGVISFGDAFQQTFSAVMESGTGVQRTFFAIADSLAQTAADGSSSLKEFATAAVGAAAKIIRAQIQEAVAGSITTALARSGIPFPFNLAAGAAAGAAASGIFNKLLSSVRVPGFARGTQYAPGGLAMVGEYGPELMNVPRGSQILSNNRTNRALEGINSQANISGEFTVRGTDLVLVLEKAQSKQKRIF